MPSSNPSPSAIKGYLPSLALYLYLREAIQKNFSDKKPQLQANLLSLDIKTAAIFLNGSFP